MLKSNLKIDKDRLKDIAANCYKLIESSNSKDEALHLIAETASAMLGDYFSPVILAEPDRLSQNFIELLDQILFEIKENNSREDSIRDYIVDDLYTRIKIYIEILIDADIYKGSLENRMMCHDDTIIISHCRMIEYVPELMDEFYQQHHLQKSIMKSLITFKADELMNFYYQILKGVFCIYIKCLALVGIRFLNLNFKGWDSLKIFNDTFNRLTDYAEHFDTESISDNDIPDNIDSIYFTVNYIELHKSEINSESAKWLFKTSCRIKEFETDNSNFLNLYQSLTDIILNIDPLKLAEYLRDNETLTPFLELIHSFPNKYFNRIASQLDSLGEEFIINSKHLINSDKINAETGESNLFQYLFIETPGIV